MSVHSDFILAPVSDILCDTSTITHSMSWGIEMYPLWDNIMQSIFMKMTGAQEQKMKCIVWELATHDYEYRYMRFTKNQLGECSNYSEKQKIYKDIIEQIKKHGRKDFDINSIGKNKILKQTSKNNSQTQPESEVQNQNQVQNQPVPQRELYPIAKTTRLQVSVEDLAAAKALLNQELSTYNADIITENYTENEGIAKQYLTVKVPLSNFNELVNKMSSLGNVESKNTEVQGNDYVGSQMCDVELTLVDNTPETNNAEDLNILNDEQKDETFGDKSSNAFMKGFAVLGGLFLALIPFWPIFLIGGIVWYFVAKRNKKKREEEFQRQLALEREKIKAAEALKPSAETPQNTEPTNAEENKNDDDISKYMPKE